MKRHTILVLAAFAAFILLGLPDGLLGVAWPSISTDLSVPLGSLGLAMLGATLGFVTITSLLGPLVARFGYRRVLLGAPLFMLLGAWAIALAPSIYTLVPAMVLIGTGAGLLDGGLNAYGAAWFGPRDLNWMHACYGVGASLGPLIMTPIVISRFSWRWGYVLYSGYALIVLILFFAIRRSWKRDSTADGIATSVHPQVDELPARNFDGVREPSARAVPWLIAGSVVLFFLYTGLEIIAGQWAYTLFTLGRGMSPSHAGLSVTVYWGSLTAGRILFGFIATRRISPATILRGCLTGALVAIVLLQFPRPPMLGAVGLGLLGLCLAPLFPLLIGETPRRVGSGRTDHVIGFQVAAAGIGGVTLVSLVGLGVEHLGFTVIGRSLLVTVLLFGALQEILLRFTALRAE